jgi:carbonic anhydrase
MTRPGRVAAIGAACVLVSACGGLGSESPTPPADPRAWNHDADDAELGTEAWGTIDASFEACSQGSEQSPIDIVDAVSADLPPLVFDYTETPLVVENTGHVIEVAIQEDATHTLTIGEEAYRLVQYHFHAPSEHTVGGVSYDVEAHFVHRNEADEIAVVGVLLDTHAPPNELLDAIITNAPAQAGEEVEVDEERSPLELLPVAGTDVEISGYSTYAGSLTTPGCTEGVRWIVLTDTLGASSTAVDRLHELIAGFPDYEGYANNNRPAQPLNDREIQSSD